MTEIKNLDPNGKQAKTVTNPASQVKKPVAPASRPVVTAQTAPKKGMPMQQVNDEMLQTDEPKKKGGKAKAIIFAVIAILLGVGSGYGLAYSRGGGNSVANGVFEGQKLDREVASEEITVGTRVGLADESTFRDSAEGELGEGGIEGEGSHHLIRPGGESQTVYITSSVIDLDQFVGRKVKVWGETLASEKAGWFMDVGILEVLE